MHQSTFIFIKPVVVFLLLCTSLALGSCQPAQKQYDYSIFAFGTLIDITLYDVDAAIAATAFEQLQTNFEHYHQNWSPWTNGELAQINQKLAKNKPAVVPLELVPIIRESIKLSEQSHSYYNPSIGRLINLWQFHRYQDNNIKPPSDHDIQQIVIQNPRMSDLSIEQINNEQYQLISKNSAVSLNFGAFAKGYAIALEIKKLQKLGIKNAIINAGGDLSVIGQHGDRAWKIGIRNPRSDKLLASLETHDNESVFTSGDYERVYHHNGKRYHHILDPRTGYPTQDVHSVTVIHSNAGRADAAATALFVAGSKHWEAIAKSMEINLVLLVDANNNIHMSPAMETRVKLINKQASSRIIISKELY